MSEMIFDHGQLNNPFEIVLRENYFVLPSLSEGTSRAAMEAFYLGLPYIMLNVTRNCELIQIGEQEYLFDEDEKLSFVMEQAVLDGFPNYIGPRRPSEFNQFECERSFLKLVNSR